MILLYTQAIKPSNYDSLIAKLIVHGNTREEAIMRLKRALKEYIIEGVNTTLSLHKEIIENKIFVAGNYDIRWLENYLSKYDK